MAPYDESPKAPRPSPTPAPCKQIGLHQIACLVQAAEIGSPPRQDANMTVFDARQQQIVCGAPRTIEIRGEGNKGDPPPRR